MHTCIQMYILACVQYVDTEAKTMTDRQTDRQIDRQTEITHPPFIRSFIQSSIHPSIHPSVHLSRHACIHTNIWHVTHMHLPNLLPADLCSYLFCRLQLLYEREREKKKQKAVKGSPKTVSPQPLGTRRKLKRRRVGELESQAFPRFREKFEVLFSLGCREGRGRGGEGRFKGFRVSCRVLSTPIRVSVFRVWALGFKAPPGNAIVEGGRKAIDCAQASDCEQEAQRNAPKRF